MNTTITALQKDDPSICQAKLEQWHLRVGSNCNLITERDYLLSQNKPCNENGNCMAVELLKQKPFDCPVMEELPAGNKLKKCDRNGDRINFIFGGSGTCHLEGKCLIVGKLYTSK